MKNKILFTAMLAVAAISLSLATHSELQKSSASPLVGIGAPAEAIHPDRATGVSDFTSNFLALLPFLALGLTAPIDTKERSGEIVTIPVKASTHLYAGGLIAVDASGYAVAAADTAALRVIGRCEVEADNSSGSSGDISVQVKRGVFLYANSTGDPIARADVGNTAFVEDDATVNKVGGTNKIRAGLIVDLETAGVWIDTRSGRTAAGYTLTSSQNATTAATDLTTSEALANALKTSYNALQADVVAIYNRLK